MRVRDLARVLGVSELTVRRDIAALAADGLLTKVHGGATLPTELEPVTAAAPGRMGAPCGGLHHRHGGALAGLLLAA